MITRAAQDHKEKKDMEYSMSMNDAFKSVEVTFTEKPAEAIREVLKGMGFRWHKVRGLWYGYKDAETVRKALENVGMDKDIAEAKKAVKKAEKAKKNYFGVKVGDMFSSSWGYEQTNVDFFQVIELVGEKSVRVREVSPRMISENPTCSMAADRTYAIDRENLLPPVAHSVFINDQEKGDLKRLKSYQADGKSNPQFYLSSFADAHYISGDTVTEYESWYY